MLLTLNRFKFTDTSTLGQWYIDGDNKFWSEKSDSFIPMYSLEDKDRNLFSYMTEKEILSVKVKHKTAIPYGNYKVTITYSERFKRDMPLIVGIKGFGGIRIHNGSFVGDTDGCPLIGYKSGFLPNENAFWISESKDAFSEFMPELRRFLKKEEVRIEIVK